MKKEEEKTKQELLEETLKKITKMFGEGAVMRLGDRPNVDLDVIPSGSLLLDEALGVGGYPQGRVIEIYGPESSGKTTLALHAIAECQKLGGRAAFIDAEHAIDPVYARNLGVNIDELILSQAELDGEMGDSTVGLQARLMSKAMRKITATLNKNECAVIFINQLRDKVGVIYGNPETTTGGKALKFYSTIRIDIRRLEAIKDGTNIVGNTCKIKVVKNKVSPPFESCEIDIIYGKGICKEGEVLDRAVELGFIKKSGVWYEYNGSKIAQGREAAKLYLQQSEEAYNDLLEKIKNYKKEEKEDE